MSPHKSYGKEKKVVKRFGLRKVIYQQMIQTFKVEIAVTFKPIF